MSQRNTIPTRLIVSPALIARCSESGREQAHCWSRTDVSGRRDPASAGGERSVSQTRVTSPKMIFTKI